MSRLVHLVRHGETEGESSIRYHGRNDVALSALGREQVGRLVPWLAAVHFAAVLHSPLRRAVTSAEILCAGLERSPGLIEEHAGLAEIDFGAIEGMTAQEIETAMPDWYRAWRAREVDGFPDGETMTGFHARIAAAWDDILARHTAGDLLIVAHRGVVRRILIHALELSAAEGQALVIELASLTTLRLAPDGGVELVALDRVP